MADKRLSAAAWDSFSKGKPWKGVAALSTALRSLDDLESIDDVKAATDALRRAEKSDKELSRHLDGIDKALLGLRQELEDQAEASAAALARQKALELPPMIGKRMVPLLSKVRAGEVMQSMIGIAGHRTAVVVSRRPVGSPQAAMLKKYLALAGAVKILKGTCIFEENAHTFVLDRAVTGLAKRLKPALHAQTGMRLAVRVRAQVGGKADGTGRSFVT